jgi:hypothetical protein
LNAIEENQFEMRETIKALTKKLAIMDKNLKEVTGQLEVTEDELARKIDRDSRDTLKFTGLLQVGREKWTGEGSTQAKVASFLVRALMVSRISNWFSSIAFNRESCTLTLSLT